MRDSTVATMDGLRVSARLVIPRAELVVRASRSSGAGGQHVNTSSTRVEVVWNVTTSRALREDQRMRLLTALATRIASSGDLGVTASDTRSQAQNRALAEARLADLVRRALIVPKVRKPTKPSRSAVQNRLETKRKQSNKKRERRREVDD